MFDDSYVMVDTPLDEECVQVVEGTDYYPAMRQEAHRYLPIVKRRFVNFDKIKFIIERFEHDAGPYCSVVGKYNPMDQEAYDQAAGIEDNLPKTWDDTSVVDWNDIRDQYIDDDDDEWEEDSSVGSYRSIF